MNSPLDLVSQSNLNIDSIITSMADCPYVEAFPQSFRSPLHLSNQNLLFRTHIQDEQVHHRDPLDAVVHTNLFSDQSSSSRRSSYSVISFDEITLHESDLDESIDEDEGETRPAKPRPVKQIIAQRRTNSTSPFDNIQTERRHRHGRKGSESEAVYRLECIRERNRVAARKYRQKQKDRSCKLERQGERLVKERNDLIQTVKRLQDEVLLLKHRHVNHLCWNCGQASS